MRNKSKQYRPRRATRKMGLNQPLNRSKMFRNSLFQVVKFATVNVLGTTWLTIVLIVVKLSVNKKEKVLVSFVVLGLTEKHSMMWVPIKWSMKLHLIIETN